MASDDDNQRIAEAMGALGGALATLGHDGRKRDQAILLGRFKTIARLDDMDAMAEKMSELARDARRTAGG